MTIDLPSPALDRIRSVFARHPQVQRAAVFGSRALGRAHPASDVDIAVWGPVDELELARIQGELDELPLPWRFDLVAMDHLHHEALRQHIDRVGLPIVEDAGRSVRSGRR